MKYIIADGLTQASETSMVKRIADDSVKLIEVSGFAEYFGPINATPCGGRQFTWTAAMVIEYLDQKVPA